MGSSTTRRADRFELVERTGKFLRDLYRRTGPRGRSRQSCSGSEAATSAQLGFTLQALADCRSRPARQS